MFNPNWPRWIRASVVDHFITNLPPTIPLAQIAVEGQVSKPNKDDTFAEIRVDGPKWKQYPSNDFLLKTEVNILLTIIIDSEKNLYEPEVIIGRINQLVSSIPVFKLGSEVGDDQAQIGCMEVFDVEPRDWTTTSDFGQVAPTDAIRQMTVEAHYKIELEGV